MSDGFAGSESSVKQNQNMSEHMSEQFNSARRDPEKELGMPRGELQRRRQEAMSPHNFVSDKSDRKFDVKSSARAQQIMSQGVDKYQRDKRKAELRKQMTILNRFRIAIGLAGVLFAVYIYVDILLPRRRAVKQRNAVLEERFQRAQRSLEEYAKEQDAVKLGGAAGPGPEQAMVRKYHVDEANRRIR